MSAQLELKNIQLAYNTPQGMQTVVRGLNLQLNAGEIGCLLGVSGSGKSSVLRAIAGFEPLLDGQILLDGEILSSTTHMIPPEKRQVGMMFQEYALFPHLNVYDNIAFGLRRWSTQDAHSRCCDLLDLTGLTEQSERYPHQISGGQQQRVALARALAPRPKILLLDEPFSNLDALLRESLSLQVRDVLKQEGMSALMVTHDQNETFAMADQLGIIDQGKIIQWDTPYEIYHKPCSRYVANFIGQGCFLQGTLLEEQRVETELGILEGVLLTPLTKHHEAPAETGALVDVLLRPDDIVHDDASPLQARVAQRSFRGAEFLYTLRLSSGTHIQILAPSHHDHALGELIGIRLEVEHIVAFMTETSATQ